METYIVRGADEQEGREVARLVVDALDVMSFRVRGLAEAARAAGDDAVVPEGATGYFEERVYEEPDDEVIRSLGSLTRAVFYSDDVPVFAYFDDGKLYLRSDECLLNRVRDEGIEPVEADGPESVVAEMSQDEA